jgi:hypothetical protein
LDGGEVINSAVKAGSSFLTIRHPGCGDRARGWGARLEDGALLERATALRRMLFSQDDDLLAVARERQTAGVFFAGLLYGHQLAATVGKYVLDLDVVCRVLDPEDMANRIEYLPLT